MSTSSTAAAAAPRWYRLGLLALVVAGLALRVWCGAVGLDSSRNFDERFTLHNVRAFLAGGWQPANGYYPSLSYLPQTALLAASQGLYRLSGWAPAAVLDASGEAFTPTAYLLCRLLSALYGAASLALLARLGRRLYGPGAGLLAAAFLGAMPAHVMSSAQIKPDILVVLLTVWAADLALTASRAPTRRHYLAAGAVVGLALAAKYTGAAACLLLVAVALGPGEGRGRRFGWLLLAGLAALGTFALLNPFLPLLLSYLPVLAEIYHRKGAEAGGSHLAVLGLELRFLARHHTLAGAVFALASLAALAVSGLRARAAERRRETLLVLASPLGYSLGYAAATTLFKGQNYLPVGAFTALAMGWGAAALARRLPAASGGGPPARWRWAVALPCLAVLWIPAWNLAYEETIPTVLERTAERLLAALEPIETRTVYLERQEEPLRLTRGGLRAAAFPLAKLSAASGQELDLADVELFPAASLAEPFYRERAAALPPAALERIEARPFWARGEAMAVLFHPWRLLGPGEELSLESGPRAGAFRLPAVPAADVASFALELPVVPRERLARVAGEPVRLWLVQDRGRKGLYQSARFRPRPGPLELEIEEPLPAAPPLLRWYRWQR
ncbi:MAG: glycosyltransferase family 39 protein [Thermoanaerobaculia bacterium]